MYDIRAGAVALAIVSCTGSLLLAAPPNVTYLLPAGAQRGTEVEVVAGGTFDKWPAKVIASDDDVQFEATAKKGRFKVRIAPKAAPGVRWVRFATDEGTGAARPFIVGALPETNEKEPNETRSQATVVGDGPAVVNGALGASGDVDLFRVELRKQTTFIASVDANYRLGSSIDCMLQLLDEAGNVLAQNIDDRGLDPRIVFEVPRDGTYFVRMFGFTAVPATAVRYAGGEDAVYRLTLTAGPFVDFAFPHVVTRGESASVELRGWNLPVDGREVKIAANAENGRRTLSLPHDFAGDAAVRVVDGAVTAAADRRDEPQSLQAPSTVIAVLNRPGTKHEYVVGAKKGTPLRVRVQSRADGYPLDAVANLYKPDGTLLVRLDDAGKEPDVDGLLTPAVDGDYRIVVEDLFGNGGDRFVYALDVRPTATDFGLSFTTAGLQAEIGKPFELTINVDRPATNTTDIAIRVEGLPAEIAPQPITSVGKGAEAKTTGKKVVFKFTPKQTFDGPVRVVGTLAGDSPSERTATVASTVVPAVRFDEAWLTVFPAGKIPPPPPAKKK